MSESFSTLPLQNIIPAYIYEQYRDDENICAFATSFNQIAQSYLDWFNATPLAVYTNPTISGLLLDWVGQGIYGTPRPVISTSLVLRQAGYNSLSYNTIAYDSQNYVVSGSSQILDDDYYKRVLTWIFYRGDGSLFNIQWLKNRVARFLNGPNGSDVDVLNYQPAVSLANGVFTIEPVSNGPANQILAELLGAGTLPLPFQYKFVVGNLLTNDGGFLTVSNQVGYPTSPIGLASGAVWSNDGLVCVAGTNPPPASPVTIYFSNVNPAILLASGASNLPTSPPLTGSGILWNNNGVVCVA